MTDIQDCPIANLTVDPEGKVRSVSDEFAAAFGWTERDLMGRPVEDLVPARLRGHHERVRRAFQAAPGTRFMGDFRSKVRLLRPSGRTVQVRIALWHRQGSDDILAFAIPIYEPGPFFRSSALWACLVSIAIGAVLKALVPSLDTEGTFLVAAGVTGLAGWLRDRMRAEGVDGGR